MDWFEKLTGFPERNYDNVRANLVVDGTRMHSPGNGASWSIGTFEMPSLHDLRQRKIDTGANGRLRVSIATGDVRAMHSMPKNAGALFQVASQFNMLEMVCPKVTPEAGVARYECDKTQGPACAIAAGAATIYRNYFVAVGDRLGQTKTRQLDGLVDLGAALSAGIGLPVASLWQMCNGYALCTRKGLDAISAYLGAMTSEEKDALRGRLRIGLHCDVEATESADRHLLSQAFCSALPPSYGDVATEHWGPFATFILESAYEATLWAGVINAQRGVSNVVYLTALGGGSFGNKRSWIDAAIRRALDLAKPFDLDVRLVSYGNPSSEIVAIANDYR